MLLICVGIFLLASWRIAGDRVWKWDLLGYVGCVNEARGMSAEENHSATFAELKRVAPADIVELLTRGDSDQGNQRGYRQAVYESPQAFNAQLGFYRGRWIYLQLLNFSGGPHESLIELVYGTSRAAGAGIVVLLLLWLRRHMPVLVAALVAWLGMELSSGFETASTASPDSLVALLLLAGAFALVELKFAWMAGPLLLAALGTRVDHVLFLAPLLGWAAVRGFDGHGKLGRKNLGVISIVATGVIYGCTAAQDTYGWWTVHWHTFQQFMPMPAQQTPAQDLLAGALYSVRSLPKFAGMQALFFCVVPVVGLLLARRRTTPGGNSELATGLCVVALVGLFAHFALFPVLWPRLMAPYWLLGWVGLASQVWPRQSATPA